MSILRRLALGTFLLRAAILFAATLGGAATAQAQEPAFKGSMLVIASDADMLSSAYADGELGPAAGEDALTVLPLGPKGWQGVAAKLTVSNSVTGPPASVAVTPDGRFAVMIETLGARRAGQHLLSELSEGRSISLVDLQNPARPRLVQRVAGQATPLSVAIDSSGSVIAVTYSGGKGRFPLELYRLSEGRLSQASRPSLPGVTDGTGFIDVAFDPTRPVIALLDAERPSLRFFRYDAAQQQPTLVPWGNVLPVDTAPFLVRFTPDGRFALVNGSYAARGLNVSFQGAPRGTVTTYQIAASSSSDSPPHHALVDRAEVGVVPEGMSISPNGEMVVTANLERSTSKPGSPDMARFSSMTLLGLDRRSGRLRRLTEVAIDGALPEMAVFDAASRFVAVTVYNHFEDLRGPGSVDFWRIERDPLDASRVELVKTATSIPVTRGPHSMVLVP